MFQSFNMEVYEKIFLLVEILDFQVSRKNYLFYNIFGYVLWFLLVRTSDLHWDFLIFLFN